MATWTGTTKTSSSWTGGSKNNIGDAYQLLIDSTYFLLIDDTYKLNIQNASGAWTNETKN